MKHSLFALLVIAAALPAAEPQIGAEDFVPSRAQPVGWRADGSGLTQGIWAGATPPKPGEWGFKRQDEVTASSQLPGLKWKVMCPNQTIASPIVVRDLVITCADPQTVLAYDRHTGELKWSQNADQLDIVFKGDAKRAAEIRRLWTVVDTLFFKYNLAPPEKGKDKRGRTGADLRALFEQSLGMTWDEAMALLEKHGIAAPQGNGLSGPKGIPKQMGKQFREWGLWQRGYSTMGLTEATPVSDGANLWMSFASNTVTCYDVANGTVKWMEFLGGKDDLPEDVMGDAKQRGRWPVSKFFPSPLLIGDILVVQHGHHLRGLDADSGKTLWAIPYCKTYYGTGTPVRMRFGKDDVILTARGWIVRVRDGKVLTRAFHELAKDRQLGGSSMFTDGKDVVVMSDSGTGGGHGRQKTMAFRISVDGDTATGEKLWEVDQAANEGSGLCHDGWVYENGFARNSRRIEVATGTVQDIGAGHLGRYGGGYGSVHVAGDQVYDWDGFNTFVGFGLADGKVVPLETARLELAAFYGDFKRKNKNPFDPTFDDRRIAARRQAWQDRLIAHFDATTTGGGEAYGQHAWFKGDKVYVRTRWELYCFGR